MRDKKWTKLLCSSIRDCPIRPNSACFLCFLPRVSAKKIARQRHGQTMNRPNLQWYYHIGLYNLYNFLLFDWSSRCGIRTSCGRSSKPYAFMNMRIYSGICERGHTLELKWLNLLASNNVPNHCCPLTCHSSLTKFQRKG